MRTRRSKIRVIVRSTTIALLAVTVLSGAPGTLAVGRNDSAQGNTNAPTTFCSRVAAHLEQRTATFAQVQSKLEERRTERLANVLERFTDRDERLAAHQERWNANRQEQFEKLEQQAINDAQRTAVVTFIEAVNAAVTARRQAVNAARTAYQEGIQQAIFDRQESVDTALATYQQAVVAALEAAQASCDAGDSPETVRATLFVDLDAARQQLAEDRQAAALGSGTVRDLVETRNAAARAAQDAFHDAMAAARDALKEAFGETASNTNAITNTNEE